MNDVELYQAVLGIQAPWKVTKVELALTDGRVDVWVEHPRGQKFACPDCQAMMEFDDLPERYLSFLAEA